MTFNNGQGYAVVYNVSDTSLLINTANPKLEGKILGTKDANGVVIAEAQINAARQSRKAARRPISTRGPARPLRSARWRSSATSRRGTSS